MLLLLAWMLAVPPGQTLAAAGGSTLSVPFLPQTEALCGGAAVAMVFRFWGDRHASVSQFEPLVDRSAGGIATTTLERAIGQRGWQTTPIVGGVDEIRTRIRRNQPVVILIEDRPSRYHYVVAIGADENAIVIHDPARGPSRRFTDAALQRLWAPAGFWGLVITPDENRSVAPSAATIAPEPPRSRDAMTACERSFEEGMDEIERRPGDAEAILERVRTECPSLAAPVRELAGVRFAGKRWRDAERLAAQAVRLDPGDAYARELLGSSRFLQADALGALDAWNSQRRPIIDRVEIAGVSRMRYNRLADYIGLAEGSVLERRRFQLAERKVADLPDRARARVSYRPDEEGYAVVDVNLVEAAGWPRQPIEWAALAAPVAINREVTLTLPGTTGQGEMWRASWRWWENRPQVRVGFAAPVGGRLAGIWRVQFGWEAQTYALGASAAERRETETRGTIGYSRWVTPSLRASLTTGLRRDAGDHRQALVALTLEPRGFGDRLAATVSATRGIGAGAASSFSALTLSARLRTRERPQGTVGIAAAAFDVVSDEAPLAYWSGAGEGRARPGLLRAHRLLDNGVIDGAIFGRRVGTVNVEVQRWLPRPALTPLAVAAFVDAAAADQRLAAGRSSQIDAGAGVRARLPGLDGTIRLDYARGLRDGANAVSIAITAW